MAKSIEPLVSVITPCYNGRKYLAGYLDSLIAQTYSNIEFICIDDGSKDNTQKILFSYKEKFKEKGIKFIYLHQENQGQATALNLGLKHFTGKYLTWPDSDDFLHKDNIKKRVEFLEKNREFDMVLCDSPILGIYLTTLRIKRRKQTKTDPLFRDCIMEKNVYYAGGAYMFRTEAFLQVNPKREIYTNRGGQNWQMILPMAFVYKCGYIHKNLYFIRSHRDSHSRRVHGLKGKVKRIDEHEDILLNTIKSISMKRKTKSYYLRLIKKKYTLRRRRTNCRFGVKKSSGVRDEFKHNNGL